MVQTAVMKRSVIIATIAAAGTLLSCTRNDLPSSGGSRLSKTIARSGDSVVISYFKYDTEGKLIRILDSAVYSHRASGISFQYNTSDQLIKTELFNDFNSIIESYSFIYQNGVVTEKINEDDPSRNKDIYAYDAQGRLIADTSYYYTFPEPVYFSFSYDNNENVISQQPFYRSSGSWIASSTVHFSYNNSPNPYYPIGLNYYLCKNDITWLSKDLVTQIDYSMTTATYTYEYYSNGLLRKLHLQYTNNAAEPVTVEFFYE